MQMSTAKFASLIQGVISGADRLVLRGSLRAIQYQFGMMGYLWHKQVPLTGFGKHAEQITKQIKEASLAQARRLLRPVQYLTSSKTDKKTLAEQIAVLRGWDYRWSATSVPTSLAVFWGEDVGRRVGGDARRAGTSAETYVANGAAGAQLVHTSSVATIGVPLHHPAATAGSVASRMAVA